MADVADLRVSPANLITVWLIAAVGLFGIGAIMSLFGMRRAPMAPSHVPEAAMPLDMEVGSLEN